MRPLIASLPRAWEVVVWDNGAGVVTRSDGYVGQTEGDRGVFGRYAAIDHASHDLIYVQDDDCIVADPGAFVHEWMEGAWPGGEVSWPDKVVCNMPEPWRSDPFYRDHALVGFGAVFHREAPAVAFRRFWSDARAAGGEMAAGLFERACDVVFTGLTPRVLVTVPHESLGYAYGPDRMWRQPGHREERGQMLERVRRLSR